MDNPFTPIDMSSEPDSPDVKPNVGVNMVQTAVHKYTEYLRTKNTDSFDALVAEGRRRARNTYISTADYFYNKIPEEHRDV